MITPDRTLAALSNLRLVPCVPPRWARSGHAQTLLGHAIPSSWFSRRGVPLRIALPDGDQLFARHLPQAGSGPESRLVVCLFHGLCNDISFAYMQRTARVAWRLGHGVLLVNHRGCGEGRGLARFPYHPGRAGDLAAAITHARGALGYSRALAIGFSLGGAALLNLLGNPPTELPDGALPDAAIAVNAPLDLGSTIKSFQEGMRRFYDLAFVWARKREMPEPEPGLGWKATYHDVEALYTARRSGFTDVEQYYARCSPKPWLVKIDRPTCLVTAADDPLVAADDYRSAVFSPSTHLHLEPVGGHLGYLSAKATPLGTIRWMDYALGELIQTMAG